MAAMMVAAVAAGLAGAAGSVHAQAKELGGPELQQLWAGKDLVGRAPNGARVILTLNPDGTARLLVGSLPDQGSWRTWERGYCTTWAGLRAGQEACYTVQRDGSADKFLVFRPDGVPSGSLEFR